MNDSLQQSVAGGHPAEELLDRFIMKDTSASETQAVDEHLQQCEYCRGELRG